MRRIIFFFVMFFLFFSIAGCTTLKTEVHCCQQCLDAASQDPSGYDLSIKECSRYELTEECREYFEQNEIEVGKCRELGEE